MTRSSTQQQILLTRTRAAGSRIDGVKLRRCPLKVRNRDIRQAANARWHILRRKLVQDALHAGRGSVEHVAGEVRAKLADADYIASLA